MNTKTITFHRVYNCGAYLQAYALQNCLIRNGIENQIIDYIPLEQEKTTALFYHGFSLKNIIKNVLTLMHIGDLQKRKVRFENLISELALTKRVESLTEFEDEIAEADCVITGSDQVWNTNYHYDGDLYFIPGNFKGKRISYAPSFGQRVDNLDNELIHRYISRFDSISAREKTGVSYLKSLLNRNIVQVCDPTFLLTKEDYSQLEEKAECKYKGDYVFLYTINYSAGIMEFATSFSKSQKIPCIALYTSAQSYSFKSAGIDVDYSGGPSEFLSYINKAKYVITDSFHATVFSIIFEKDFWKYSVILDEKKNKDNRTDDLLCDLNISSRIVSSLSEVDGNSIINYEDVNRRLKKIVGYSKEWLIKAIS